MHECMGMKLDHTKKGKLIADMKDCIKEMTNEYSENINSDKVPWNDKLFKVDKDSTLLLPEEAEIFHTFVMKGMFLVKRVRPDKESGMGFLSSRVRDPT